MTIATMPEIKRLYADKHAGRPGGYWFSANSMRFFGTRLSRLGYPSSDQQCTYFVTSEQPPHGPRRWSVRCIRWADGEIDTVGKFCVMTRRTANCRAAAYAAGKTAVPT